MNSTTLQLSSPLYQQPLPTQLQWLINALQNTPNLTPASIKQLVEQAQISESDLLPWADFTHPVTDSYGRKLVLDGGHFEIMVMSWLPGDMSAIHDHGATEWGAVQSFGSAAHYTYTLRDTMTGPVLNTPTAAPYTPGMVREVDHYLVHQMGNTSEMPFLSLHVYGLAQNSNAAGAITGNARIFDLLEGSIQYTDGGVFFCLPESQVNHREYGLSAAAESVSLHNQQMSDRICRIIKSQCRPDLQRKLGFVLR